MQPSKECAIILFTFLFALLHGSTTVGFTLYPFTSNQRLIPNHGSRLHSVVVQDVVETDETAPKKRFMYMTAEQDEILRVNGNREAELMRHKLTMLKATKIKRSSGGFGGKAAKNMVPRKEDQSYREEAAAYAQILKQDGIVRIDNVLSDSLADQLKAYLVDLRARATADIENGLIEDSQLRFADVLLNQNRCDLKIPLGPTVVNDALHHVLSKSVVRDLIEHVFDSYGRTGNEATLYELNCFMSNSGARRQLVHADNACMPDGSGLAKDEPIMLTCFISLQDIDETMGPTVFLLGTHNQEAHDLFYETKGKVSNEESTKDRLLRTSQKVMATLPKGSCAIFDPRVLHCAGGNTCEDPNKTRALFYVSFKNPVVDHPGCPSCSGYGIADAGLTVKELCSELEAAKQGEASWRFTALSCNP